MLRQSFPVVIRSMLSLPRRKVMEDMAKETKLTLLDGLTVSDDVRDLIEKKGLAALKEAARVQRAIALNAKWTVSERPDKTHQEIAAHEGKRVANLLNGMFDSIVAQAAEVGNYIAAVQLALDGHGTIEGNLQIAAEHQKELDRLREDENEKFYKKSRIAKRTKVQQTPEMALARKVVTIWAEAGGPRGLPQKAIDEVVAAAKPKAS